MNPIQRRRFLKSAGVTAAALPFLGGLRALSEDADAKPHPVQRLVIMFTPNGIIGDSFWPKTEGENYEMMPILKPLEKFRSRVSLLKGIDNKVRGDGDSHMRGMSCLLTGTELMPGNIQGGSHTPAGWGGGISIDQEIANFCQTRADSRTRFGSLEFGVNVPDVADPWTRMSYTGANRPVAPISNPYAMFSRIYGRDKNQEVLKSVLDDVRNQLKRVGRGLDDSAREMLDQHQQFVSQMEKELSQDSDRDLRIGQPTIPDGVRIDNDHMPEISRMQREMLVNGFANDMNRVATLQYTKSVGNARMTWLGINEGHHQLSHDPDLKKDSQEKLVRINQWFAGELARLMELLDATPEPRGQGSLLDHTLIVWTNELGKGNSHTLNDIPMLLAGGAHGMQLGRYHQFEHQPHNRLWMNVAKTFGHELETFGKPEFSEGGCLAGL